MFAFVVPLSWASSIRYQSPSYSSWQPWRLLPGRWPCKRRSELRTKFGVLAQASSPAEGGKQVVIFNTKGGGHAFIGLHLARVLLKDGHSVCVYNVGGSSAKKPFSSYEDLERQFPGKFKAVFGDLENAESIDKACGLERLDVVYDNNAKSVDEIRGVVEFAKKNGARQLLYVSSAGTYKYDGNVMPHLEGDEAAGGQIDVERYLNEQTSLECAAFRPIYIVGADTAKRDYTDFFFDRIVRSQPIPIPGSGDELTSITTVEDVAGMLASAIGKEIGGQVFNMTSPRCVSFDGLARMCAKAAGKDAKLVHYDPNEVDGANFSVKKAFPFRPRHFFADSSKAQEVLGWTPKLSRDGGGLEAAIQKCYDEYVSYGLSSRDVSFAMDKAILGSK